MTALIVVFVLLAAYLAALRWTFVAGVSADQDRIDDELAAMRAHQASSE